jgi:propanediol utilization protein
MNPNDAGSNCSASDRIAVAIAPPHVYLTPEAIEELFCDGYRLHELLRANQPTQYLAQESVTLIGPRGRLPGVRVIGPPRSMNQIEISAADARVLGIDAPLREPGDLEGTPGVVIAGPRTIIALDRGVVRARRHLHMTPEDARRFGLKDRDRAAVATPAHEVLFHDVLVRVSPDCRLELHLNPDEGDAAALHSGDYVVLHPRIAAAAYAGPGKGPTETPLGLDG